MANIKYWEGIGRRKATTVRVRIYQSKDIANTVNEKPLNAFFNDIEIAYIKKPLSVVNQTDQFRFSVKALGGGKTIG